MNLKDDLNNRNKSHGCFYYSAKISQGIKYVMHHDGDWDKLNCIQKEALDNIAIKISRIISGDQDLIDHWYDISGYAELARQDAESRCQKNSKK